MKGKGRGSGRKGDEAEGIRFLCVGLYGHGVELLGCCLCTAKALAWAVCVALPTVPIFPALNGFHYSHLECRRRFFQTVIYVFKQSEQTEELDAGHPPSLSWPLVTPVPHGKLGEEEKSPQSPSFSWITPCWKSPDSSTRLSPTVLHHHAGPGPVLLQHTGLCPSVCDILCSLYRALQPGWTFQGCNTGHFFLTSPVWGCWS